MSVYAISDLHLAAHETKPMDIFGAHWENHFERIAADWQARVRSEDIVLLPGDLSWAMTLDDALDDLKAIAALNGKKIITRGNHDYWWSAIGRLRRALSENMFAIQNDFIELDGMRFAGTRGWTIPTNTAGDSDDARIYTRERMRLEMSLKSARKNAADMPLIVMMHYPPLMDCDKGFSDLLEEYHVDECVYGHLHGAAIKDAFNGTRNGVNYHLVSCDGLDFKLKLIRE